MTFLISSSYSVIAQQRVVHADTFVPSEAPISASRMFMVGGKEQTSVAKNILGDAIYKRIDQSVLARLFSRKFDCVAMLTEQINEAESYAAKRENEAALPLFSKDREGMLREAAAHRGYAAYTKELSSALLPYVIKVRVALQGTGQFYLHWQGNRLVISYGALGSGDSSPEDVFLVIFVERAIAAIEVTSVTAQ